GGKRAHICTAHNRISSQRARKIQKRHDWGVHGIRSLRPHSDRITQLEHDAIQSKLTTMEKENTMLKANVEDLISRSKRHNIRVVGLPEGLEGKIAREFMTNLLSELLCDSLTEPPELDRAHRSLRP
ncbi:hypothetical protein PO909_006794, partial [Leuciscus waleckii]